MIILKPMWNQFNVRARPWTELVSRKGPMAKKTLLGVAKCAEFLDQLSVYHLVTKDCGHLKAVGHLFKAEENYDDIISKNDAVQTALSFCMDLNTDTSASLSCHVKYLPTA
jgi:hypothetical protein